MKAILIKTDKGYGLVSSDKTQPIASTLNPHDSLKLSKKNCDEIFGVVDVEKLAEESWGDKISSPYHAYIEGFKKAMEIYQPTEIEVEIEMREDYLMWKHSDIEKMSDCLVPKLDSSGCLILKKI
jgi:hypothetical protein